MAAAFSHLLNPHPLRSVFQRVPSRREFIVLIPSHGRRQYVKFAFLFSCSNLKFFSKIWRVNRVFKLPARHRVGLLARLTGGVKRRVISANGGREGVQSFDRRRVVAAVAVTGSTFSLSPKSFQIVNLAH